MSQGAPGDDGAALYFPEGSRFLPTAATAGPWDKRSQHGGAASALLAHAIERVEVTHPMPVVRLTFDLLRPVPMVPLEVRTEVVRVSRRTTLLAASLVADDAVVVRAAALCIRSDELDLPVFPEADDRMAGAPGAGTLAIVLGDGGAYNDTGVEIRFVEGGFEHPGPALAWTRLRMPVVAGEPLTPIVRAAAAADLGNGLSSVLRQREWRYLNADLNLHLARGPAGEWIALRSLTLPFGPGSGMAESALYDATGRFARATQALVVDKRN